MQTQLQVPVEVLQNDCSEMECVLEAANALVDVLDYASTQLDALTKAGHKRCLHLQNAAGLCGHRSCVRSLLSYGDAACQLQFARKNVHVHMIKSGCLHRAAIR